MQMVCRLVQMMMFCSLMRIMMFFVLKRKPMWIMCIILPRIRINNINNNTSEKDYFNYSDNLDINFELELYLNKDNINNIKEDNIIEKD